MLVRLLISIWKDSTCKAQKPYDLCLSFSILSPKLPIPSKALAIAPFPLLYTPSLFFYLSSFVFVSCFCLFFGFLFSFSLVCRASSRPVSLLDAAPSPQLFPPLLSSSRRRARSSRAVRACTDAKSVSAIRLLSALAARRSAAVSPVPCPINMLSVAAGSNCCSDDCGGSNCGDNDSGCDCDCDCGDGGSINR